MGVTLLICSKASLGGVAVLQVGGKLMRTFPSVKWMGIDDDLEHSVPCLSLSQC